LLLLLLLLLQITPQCQHQAKPRAVHITTTSNQLQTNPYLPPALLLLLPSLLLQPTPQCQHQVTLGTVRAAGTHQRPAMLQ
jgi:hypothetical protein